MINSVTYRAISMEIARPRYLFARASCNWLAAVLQSSSPPPQHT
jgi:hypothetical protein